MNPKASIILLTYNQAGSVGRAMESILCLLYTSDAADD